MSETANTEAGGELGPEELHELVEATARNICDAYQGVTLMAHIGLARRLVQLVVDDMIQRGYIQEALSTLQAIDADIVQAHNTIIAAIQQAGADGQEEAAAATG
jgi:hypothetical protein